MLGVLILGIGAVIAAKPRLSPNLVAGILLVCALGIVTAGVVSGARGERFIEHHDEEHHDGEGPAGLEPNIPAGTKSAVTVTTEAGGHG